MQSPQATVNDTVVFSHKLYCSFGRTQGLDLVSGFALLCAIKIYAQFIFMVFAVI